MRPTRSTCAIALSLVLLCQASADAQPRKFEPPTARQREIAGRRLLVDARALVQQGRLDAAVGTLRRSLLYAPNEARSHDLLARVLAKLGRDEEAQAHRALADAIAPPPTPMPEEPLFADSEGLFVVLVPPPDTSEPLERVANDWPTGIAAQTLENRLQTRLPGAVVVHANPLTVSEARALLTANSPGAVLSLRVDRLYCRDTIKDGPYAVAWLRVAGETPGDPSEGPDEVREVVFNPRLSDGCRAEALARAVERVLRYRNVLRTIDARTNDPHARAWSTAAIRALFPGLGERIKVALDRGRTQISTGHVAAAGETLRAAAVIDPGDEVVHAYLHEVDATLSMASEIAARHDPEHEREEDRGVLDPRFSPAQRAAAEEQLAEARRERDSLLAAVAALGDDIGATSPDALARLHRGEILDPNAFGPRTARMRAGSEVEARVAYTPDGHEITLLDEQGIYVKGFFFPVVPRGQSRIRVQLSASHTPEQIDRAVDAFTTVGKQLGVLG